MISFYDIIMWLFLLIIGQVSGLSFNQPKLCHNATWNENATTFADNRTVGIKPQGIFVTSNNTIYVANRASNRIVVWFEGNNVSVKNLSNKISLPYSVFVTTTDEIYIDSSNGTGRIDKWTLTSTTGVPTMYTCAKCYDIHIDMNNNLYCSLNDVHQIVAKSLNMISNTLKIMAGTGTPGNSSNMLNRPFGIYVDNYFNLYVADRYNHRIQFFPPEQLNGTTIAGNSSLNFTITLNYPSDITLDSDNYMFIVDSGNNRIIRSGPNGFDCLIGCSLSSGSAANQLNNPTMLSFDSYGNIFVVDSINNRIQQFALVTNVCSNNNATPINNNSTSQSNLLSTTTTVQSNLVTLASSQNVVSYNRPKLDPYATWSANAITFADNNTVGTNPLGIFININNTIYSMSQTNGYIQIWSNNSISPTKTIFNASVYPCSFFVTSNGDIYIDNGLLNGQVTQWKLNANTGIPVMSIDTYCFGLFVDISNTLYCSMPSKHRVITKSLNSNSNIITIVAGTGCPGSTSNMLSSPYGIFVNTNFDLYVADCFNNRIQVFQSGQLNAITVAGNTSLNTTIILNYPVAVILDADSYLFIVDNNAHRIVGSGPNGFRCLVGCFRSPGFASNQLDSPATLSFDSFGNLFVADYGNNRVQKFTLLNNSLVPSYNQPIFCPNATWTANADTFANLSTVGSTPFDIFIDINNTIYVVDNTNSTIQIWSNNSILPAQTISGFMTKPFALFVTNNDNIYIDNGNSRYQVDKYSLTALISNPIMYVNDSCYGLFVDISNNLYCSLSTFHQVVKRYVNDNSTTLTIVAGTGTAGLTSQMLNNPRRIFVDIYFDLYVADCDNDRIQRFHQGQLDGITVAGNGSLNITIELNRPHGIVLDGNKYMFISDRDNHRIIRSGPYGFYCIFGCSGSFGSASNQLNKPSTLSFDSYGNIFVVDTNNGRIQKFPLATNSCDELTTTMIQNPSTAQISTAPSPISLVQQVCFAPTITLVPGLSTLSSPIQYRRSQDFFIVSIITLNCNNSLSFKIQWTVMNCTSFCSNSIQLDSTIATTLSELYIPARTLSYGLYKLTLTVTMVNMSSLSSSSSVYVQISATGIVANLVQYGTSMITRGNQQKLQLDPGSYSVDLDGDSFNASNWKYKYYCRIYGFFTFPNLQGSLLTIDDMRNDTSNPSCLSNRTGWQLDNSTNSSLTILPGSLQSNRTYQFMVHMENRQNSSTQAAGYVLVKVEDSSPQLILISCVIWTLCEPNLEYQRVNPTTQVALFSVCAGNCTGIQNITWNIYYGTLNTSTNFTQWTLFNQMSAYRDIWFFGANTSNFTASNQLFTSNSQIKLWRFEVVYTFTSERSLSSLNFIINQPPENGSCSINPSNGTTSSLFNISCLNWFDEDSIKDYAVYAWTTDPTYKIIVAYSTLSIFSVQLPVGDNQTSLLHLSVNIRDQLDCITELNISAVTVISDTVAMTNLISDIQSSSSGNTTNPIIQLLASGNQNIVGQVLTSVSQQFNQMNNDIVDKAISNGIPVTSISISSLSTQSGQQPSISVNQSVLNEYNKQLNSHATVRDYLISFTTQLPITTANSIKLQASSLVQLTKSTNELTRAALTVASDRCYRLTMALYSMRTRIPFEDVQTAASDLLQCAANVLSAVNGPLQQRTTILDLDSSRATTFPQDYDTDLESEWANPNLFSDGNDFSWETIQKNRNSYYQNELANQIMIQMKELITLITSSLNIHLNIGQDFIVDTSQVLMSLETKSFESFSNQFNKQIGNGQIQLPQNFNSFLNTNEKVSIRSIMEPLAAFGNSKSQSNTNLSRSISFSFLDSNQNELPIQTDLNHSITIIVPRDPNLIIPPMILQNVTSLNSTPHNLIFHYHYLNLTTTLPVSVHWEIQPLNTTVAYLFIYRFDQIPQLNSSINQIDGWTLLCPSNLINNTTYRYFIDNQLTVNHQAIIFGLRELNSTEINQGCFNSSINYLPITNEHYHFSTNYQLRIYTSGCYYLDANNQWKADGVVVGSLTNHYETQCFSTHLTSFSGGFTVLPESVNWSYVFANADFMKNKTIYITVICVSAIYIILLVYSRYKDKKDIEKLGVTPLSDNHPTDQYFYQIIVFTGQRKDAGTKSNVCFVLHGDNDDTQIRRLADPQRPVLQRGGINAFIMSVPKSLGLLSCIRLWHDNSGKGSSSSWFLKYIIIRDLQTMEKFHFICQRWFAVEKDDGKIERVLPVASEIEKRRFSYLLTKRTYHSISDGHLWFSIFSRPPSNTFTRVQRCTCCFVLLFTSMFLNIMYYDLSNETNMNLGTDSARLSFGSFYISPQQIIIGIIVEFFALIPSLLLVQLFRRLRSRQQGESSLQQTLYRIKPDVKIRNDVNRKKSLTFPWWCIFIAYGLCIALVGVSILFIIARGIEFGDVKTQKWLASILSGFFSSMLLTQPLKIISLAILFACFCGKSNDDKEANEFLDDNQIDLDYDEEYLHSMEDNVLYTNRSSSRVNRLDDGEVDWARNQRLKEIHMWAIIREVAIYIWFLSLLYIVIYANRNSNSYLPVKHLRSYFFNSRQNNMDYTKISTINQYWNWLENSFVENIRAQQWYNGDLPRNLSGFINDKTNRLMGWPTIRQIRIKSTPCHLQNSIASTCLYDYSLFDEDKESYQPGWINHTLGTFSSSINQAFVYKSRKELNTYMYVGDHETYGGGGYTYELRGRLSDLRSNLSELHRLGWIDNRTRAVIIQMTLYNPNVDVFIFTTFLLEFLSTGGIHPTARFEPLNFYAFTSIFQLICTILYLIMIIYLMYIEIRSMIELKMNYFRRFWSYIELGIIICSWISVGIYIWRHFQFQHIGDLFKETNGYVYVNLQSAAYVNDILTYLLSFCCFFGTIKCIRLCRFNQRLCLFIHTLQYASKELFSFAIMFSVVFISFISLFYLIFTSTIWSCSTLLTTTQMLFEMTLMKFDAHELVDAAAFLGPFCFSLFIIFVVFICMSMFLSIINRNFQRARENLVNDDQMIFSYMMKRFQRATGLLKLNEEEVQAERDALMRLDYHDPIERFPDKIDQLLETLNRLYMNQKMDAKKKI